MTPLSSMAHLLIFASTFTCFLLSFFFVWLGSSGLDLEQRTQVLGNILDNQNRLLHQGAINDVSTAIVDLTLTKKVGKSLKEVAEQLSKNTQFNWIGEYS